MTDVWTGLALVAAAGVMGGSFTVPLKAIRGWPWEKSWLLYSLVGMVIVPWLLVIWAVPHPAAAFASVSGTELARTALFGLGWGIGSVLFGLGVTRVGTALAFAIVVSMTATLGSLIPLAVLQPAELTASRTLWLLLGLVIVLVGLALCAAAGFLKEAEQKRAQPESAAGGDSAHAGGFLAGLLICLVAGLTSPMFNFSLAFGSGIQREAERQGADRAFASVAVIAVAVSAGFLTNAAYCLFLLRRNRSWRTKEAVIDDRSSALRNGALVILMGLLWMFGMFAYGVGAGRMGPLGPVLGWPLFMTLMVLMGNFWGTVTGEWRGAGRRAYFLLQLGNAAMVGAFIVISMASRPSG
jgi:L-rhamnose-H+ transport protein